MCIEVWTMKSKRSVARYAVAVQSKTHTNIDDERAFGTTFIKYRIGG